MNVFSHGEENSKVEFCILPVIMRESIDFLKEHDADNLSSNIVEEVNRILYE